MKVSDYPKIPYISSIRHFVKFSVGKRNKCRAIYQSRYDANDSIVFNTDQTNRAHNKTILTILISRYQFDGIDVNRMDSIKIGFRHESINVYTSNEKYYCKSTLRLPAGNIGLSVDVENNYLIDFHNRFPYNERNGRNLI